MKEISYDNLKGYNFLKLMKHSFNPLNAKDMNDVLEFDFIDLKEQYHFIIKDGKCELRKGKSDNYTTKVITTYETWIKILIMSLMGCK
ncbi:hypothetical protein [Caloranaerobacter sp. DY30410]|uniref:hypothetical protein n=1 Tax=Caloranaerobacter sp. DY30410 TaxID=3238305 RepID=UPI003D0773DF